ncbi:MAG: hypothetical protein KAV99_00175 [Candidatus Latescibacteria bacterium]|nr:hypothetical protein [Candidatus Latescibacterota bacterium]
MQLLSQFPDIGTAIPGYSHKIWKVRAKCTDVRKGKRAGYRMMRSVCGRLRGPITILVSWVTVFVAHRTKEMRYYALGLGGRLRGQGIPDA